MARELTREELPAYTKLRRADLRMAQKALALKIGVSATALCRFEGGAIKTLGDSSIARLCDALTIERPSWLDGLPAPAAEGIDGADDDLSSAAPVLDAIVLAEYFCPCGQCLLNRPFVLGGAFWYVPSRVRGPKEGVVCCRFCATILRCSCRHCAAPFVSGSAVCYHCSTPYIESEAVTEQGKWAAAWNAEARALLVPADIDVVYWASSDPAKLSTVVEPESAGRHGEESRASSD